MNRLTPRLVRRFDLLVLWWGRIWMVVTVFFLILMFYNYRYVSPELYMLKSDGGRAVSSFSDGVKNETAFFIFKNGSLANSSVMLPVRSSSDYDVLVGKIDNARTYEHFYHLVFGWVGGWLFYTFFSVCLLAWWRGVKIDYLES